jgi:hypothetical protein
MCVRRPILYGSQPQPHGDFSVRTALTALCKTVGFWSTARLLPSSTALYSNKSHSNTYMATTQYSTGHPHKEEEEEDRLQVQHADGGQQ